MADEQYNELTFYLFKCLTDLNVPEADDARMDTIVTGQYVAQVLAHLNSNNISDDDDIWKIVNLESDASLPRSDCERNWHVLIDRISLFFNSTEYDLSLQEMWMFSLEDLLNRKDDAVIDMIIIIIGCLVVGQSHARPKILNLLNEFPQHVKDDISNRVRIFVERIKRSNVDANENSSVEEIRQYRAKLTEISQANEKLKKEKDSLSSEILELKEELQILKKKGDEASALSDKLEDTELKIKHLESVCENLKNEHINSQRLAQDAEFSLEQIKIKLEGKEESLKLEQSKNFALRDECDTLSNNETKLRQIIKDHEGKIRLLENGLQKNKELEKRIQTYEQRLENYAKQLAEADSLKTKVVSLEQLLSNHEAQREQLNNELRAVLNRANAAEAEAENIKMQLKREISARSDNNTNHESFDTNAMSLHEELSNTSFNNSFGETAEWKAKCEALTYENARLIEQCKQDKEIHERSISDYSNQVQSQHARAEAAELELTNVSKRVANLENENKKLNEMNTQLIAENEKFRLYLEKAAGVIRIYSEGQESAAENLKLRNDLEKAHRELDTLRQNMDQYKHESCQEQRLIASKLYQMSLKEASRRNVSSHPLNGASQNGNENRDLNKDVRPFLHRQLDTAEFTASSSAASLRFTSNAIVSVPVENNKATNTCCAIVKTVVWTCVALLLFVFSFGMLRYQFCKYNKNGPCTFFGNYPFNDVYYYLTYHLDY